MRNVLEYYQNLPLQIDPIAFSIGSFSIGWYSLMYVVCLGVIYLLLSYRIKKDIGKNKLTDFRVVTGNRTAIVNKDLKNLLVDFLLLAFVGALIGGRLGYVLFYNPLYYFNNPLNIISPYDFLTGEFVGIYGMSYHGGLLGVVLVSWLFTRKNKLNFWKWADFVVPAIPAGYFFGRIGNFLNLELYGRVTDSSWGMYFPLATGAGGLLRFPSQIIEAGLEGAILFAILWNIRNGKRFAGYLTLLYLAGYGVARFVAEFFRDPDKHIGYIWSYFTFGQILSVLMIFGVALILYVQKKRKIV